MAYRPFLHYQLPSSYALFNTFRSSYWVFLLLQHRSIASPKCSTTCLHGNLRRRGQLAAYGTGEAYFTDCARHSKICRPLSDVHRRWQPINRERTPPEAAWGIQETNCLRGTIVHRSARHVWYYSLKRAPRCFGCTTYPAIPWRLLLQLYGRTATVLNEHFNFADATRKLTWLQLVLPEMEFDVVNQADI